MTASHPLAPIPMRQGRKRPSEPGNKRQIFTISLYRLLLATKPELGVRPPWSGGDSIRVL